MKRLILLVFLAASVKASQQVLFQTGRFLSAERAYNATSETEISTQYSAAYNNFNGIKASSTHCFL